MKLIVGNQPIALFSDSELAIEKFSPALNENKGSYSYPFSVPTEPNQHKLGWPGKLERTDEIPSKSFIVEDTGIQVLRGEIEYDTVSKTDIGIILTSGQTEFYTLLDKLKSDGLMLPDLDFGSETWFSDQPTTWELWQAKLSAWDANNRADNAPFVVAPFQYFPKDSPVIFGNKHDVDCYLTQEYADLDVSFMYQLQFRAWWVLQKIFENLGYTVVQDELKDGDFKQLVILSRPFLITLTEADQELFQNQIVVHPVVDLLQYAFLMPKVTAFDLVEEIRVLMGLAFDIDDLKREVKVLLLKNIIDPVGDVVELTELSGWLHKEGDSSAENGYSLSYMGQDNALDNRSDYIIDLTVSTMFDLPDLIDVPVGYNCRVNSVARDLTNLGDYYAEIGRLKPLVSGLEKTKIEFNVKLPESIYNNTLFRGPKIALSFTASEHGMPLYDMEDIYCSLYRGMTANAVIATIPIQIVPIPFLSADRWILTETIYLSPQGIYNSLYVEFLTWKASNPRSFTKYIRLTLPQLLALQWNSRYVISGVNVLLSKINYDLPFSGIVKVEGYVV